MQKKLNQTGISRIFLRLYGQQWQIQSPPRKMPIQIENQTEADLDRRAQLLTQAAKQHHLSLLHFVPGMTRQWQDAENIVQDLWRYVLIYFPEENITKKRVLFSKARSLVIDHVRASKRKPAINGEEFTEFHAAKQSQETATSAEKERLKQSFFADYPGLQLSEDQRQVLWLHARYGFTYTEISTTTGRLCPEYRLWLPI